MKILIIECIYRDPVELGGPIKLDTKISNMIARLTNIRNQQAWPYSNTGTIGSDSCCRRSSFVYRKKIKGFWLMDWNEYVNTEDDPEYLKKLEIYNNKPRFGSRLNNKKIFQRLYWENLDNLLKVDDKDWLITGNLFYLIIDRVINEVELTFKNVKDKRINNISFILYNNVTDNITQQIWFIYKVKIPAEELNLPNYFYGKEFFNLHAEEQRKLSTTFKPTHGQSIFDQNCPVGKYEYEPFEYSFRETDDNLNKLFSDIPDIDMNDYTNNEITLDSKSTAFSSECAFIAGKSLMVYSKINAVDSDHEDKEKAMIAYYNCYTAKTPNDCHTHGWTYGDESSSLWQDQYDKFGEWLCRPALYGKFLWLKPFLSFKKSSKQYDQELDYAKKLKRKLKDVKKDIRQIQGNENIKEYPLIPIYDEPQLWGWQTISSSDPTYFPGHSFLKKFNPEDGRWNKVGRIWQFLINRISITMQPILKSEKTRASDFDEKTDRAAPYGGQILQKNRKMKVNQQLLQKNLKQIFKMNNNIPKNILISRKQKNIDKYLNKRQKIQRNIITKLQNIHKLQKQQMKIGGRTLVMNPNDIYSDKTSLNHGMNPIKEYEKIQSVELEKLKSMKYQNSTVNKLQQEIVDKSKKIIHEQNEHNELSNKVNNNSTFLINLWEKYPKLLESSHVSLSYKLLSKIFGNKNSKFLSFKNVDSDSREFV